jgi:hypothetical protein
MRHIKLYEGFETDDYYKELSSSPFGDWSSIEYENFTQSEIDWMKSNIKMDVPNDLWFGRTEEESLQWTSECPRYVVGFQYTDPKEWVLILCFKTRDEYFRVESIGDDHSDYYVCDQFDGLKKLLKDLKVI